MLGTLTAGTQQVPGANLGNAAGTTQYGTSAPTTVFKTDEHRQIAQVAMDVIAEISREREPGPSGQPLVASTQALTQASIQQQITQRVQERLLPKQGDMLATAEPSPVADIVQQTVAVLVEHTIDIPRISVVPKGPVKSGYPLQKFHSDTERVLACVMERDALRWFRPVAGQFNIYYRSGAASARFEPEYVPDFVAATADYNLIIETKAAKDMEAGDVKAKADAAATWCKNASDYSRLQGGKPWKYLLVPHDAMAHNVTISTLAARFSV
jgi:hypothetical protein